MIKKAWMFFISAVIAAIPCEGLLGQPQDYYPLQVGNLWHYESWFNGQFLGYRTYRILGDTLMPNGKRYFLTTEFWKFARMTDSLYTYSYDWSDADQDSTTSEVLMDNFNAGHNEEWITYKSRFFQYAKVKGVFKGTVFGDSVQIKVISYYRFPYDDQVVSYSDKHGIIYEAGEGGGEYILAGARINGIVYGTITSIAQTSAESINRGALLLHDPYPNPFNSHVSINYRISEPMDVSIAIFSVLGHKVKTIVQQSMEPGEYSVPWDLRDNAGYALPSGIYFVQLQAPKTTIVKKVIAIR